MGDTKKHRKKYARPRHPWIKSRILEEKELKREYGLKNNTELWRMQMVLTKAKNQAKSLVVRQGEQAEKERKQLVDRMIRYGFLREGQTMDDILFLTQRDILDRRLQSIVFRKKLAQTIKQARQFITHEHIAVNGKVITSPSYLVTVEEEAQVDFIPTSQLADPDHPERNPQKALEMKALAEEEAKKAEEEAKKAEEAKQAEAQAQASNAEEQNAEEQTQEAEA
ncbi:30S ribosomal protein S4 [Candidatus Woesearchaeota archaeon]|nr:MAG: 30S ribosomal protein S4 [Candidatus Woesearchaeota archaeon]